MNDAVRAEKPRDTGASIDLPRLHARDPTLLTQLVEDLSPRIWTAIRRYAQDDDDADDLLQDCWVRILDRLDSFKRRGPFAAWAIAVSRNVCKTRLRQRKLARGSVVLVEDISEIAGRGPDPLDALRTKREQDAIYAALAKLPDRERDAIVLRVLEGRDARETGATLGVTPDTVRSLLQRGMYRLRRMQEIRVLLGDWMGE